MRRSRRSAGSRSARSRRCGGRRVDLLFATTNPGKLRELRRLVAGLAIRVVSTEDLSRALPDVDEDGGTFQENAEKKASAYARLAGMHALADDSGLSVDALGGAPGVRSARWSDEEPGPVPASAVCELAGAAAAELGPLAGRAARDERNNDKLLRSLAGLPGERRRAAYQAVLSVARPDGAIVASVTGTCRGQHRPRAPRDRRVRLRPALRPRRAGRADDGGALTRGEGRDLAPRRRVPEDPPRARAARARRLTARRREARDCRSRRRPGASGPLLFPGRSAAW